MERRVIKKEKVIGTRGYKYELRCNQCSSLFTLGGNNFNKGRGLFCSRKCRSSNLEEREKNSKRTKEQYTKGRLHPRGMLGKTSWNKGKENLYWKGDKNPNWNNGSSYGDYGQEFDIKLKRKIRSRDKFTCRLCNSTEKSLKRKLDVHHIDYDKKNNKEENLISMCHRCHTKTNPKRNRKHFSEMLSKMNYDICRPPAIDKTGEADDKKLLR